MINNKGVLKQVHDSVQLNFTKFLSFEKNLMIKNTLKRQRDHTVPNIRDFLPAVSRFATPFTVIISKEIRKATSFRTFQKPDQRINEQF